MSNSDDSRPGSVIHQLPPAPTPTPSVHSVHPEHPPEPQAEEPVPPTADQTTLLQNEEESFALAPVDASALKGRDLLLVSRMIRCYVWACFGSDGEWFRNDSE